MDLQAAWDIHLMSTPYFSSKSSVSDLYTVMARDDPHAFIMTIHVDANRSKLTIIMFDNFYTVPTVRYMLQVQVYVIGIAIYNIGA